MDEILFLTRDEVVEIHRDQIERYGGSLGNTLGLLYLPPLVWLGSKYSVSSSESISIITPRESL